MFDEPQADFGERVLFGPATLSRLLEARALCLRGISGSAYAVLSELVVEMHREEKERRAEQMTIELKEESN